ncbi:protocadherin-11 X-linked-like isoform X2 [Physella acuta]|uniref:protocadherin-11 X-linked-like isoform X2 n=1 Tax=Physella acuta TaxID=109671 RepID=UPI0027DDE86D|nr:protocadherin-11 X-linked-like isoform X2 [Physella acuta]
MTHRTTPTLRQTMSATFTYLLAGVVLTSISMTRGQQQDLTYKIREEQDVGTFVGNIARDSQIYIQYNQTEFQSLQYSIPSTSSKFTIDSKSSTVRTAVVLDRETECDSPSYLTELCQLNFGVSVYRVSRDGSFTLLRIIRVSVVLEDINDNAPQFPSNQTTLDAPESLDIGQVLTTSGAIDRDSSVNNTVQKYTLEGGDGVFELQQIPIPGSMNSDLGIVLKQKLDRETIPSYRLKIIAEDGGFPKLSGTVRILIRVIDVNDNTPTFSQNLYNASVPEDRPERSTILKIEAQDPDEGENGRMTFTFSPLTSSRITEYFAINEANGDIFLVRRLDYERDKLFRFSMTVSDNGSPPRSSQTTIQIFVEDVNDNAPQIEITLPTAYVKESINVGNYIAHVSLSDRDSSENSVITCAVQNDHFMLQKFPESDSIYTVILKSHLDYEKSQTEFVNITCHDGGQPPLYNSSGFMIYVQDVNDNAPVFTRGTYRAEVEEENYVGQFVTQVQAVDPDEGDNGNVSYGLLVNPDSKFQINPLSGVIKAVMTLDREETPTYELVVVAKDRGIPPISSSVTVTVVLTDINDNPPRFTKSIFDFRIQENLPKNTIVDTVSASDPDTGSDNHIRFQFTINFSYRDTFAIDRLTGNIITLKSLDREERDFYAFDVMVLDESQPTYNDVAKVYITVTDDNDNKPVITYPDDYNNTFYFVYTYPAGTVLVNFQCEDRDAGENASVRFSIIRGNEKSLFFLNALNGELVLAKQLNIYDAGSYRLSVLARDNGLSYLESKRDINIIITIANGTSSFLQDDVTGANIAIVIALVCITVVLAMAVLITICIIRRIDRERKQHSSVKVDDDNLYKQQTMPDNLMHTPGKDGFESEIEKLKRKIKRDMSFGVEDDSNTLDAAEISNKSSTFSTFKNTSTAVEQKNTSSPQAHSSVLHNTLSPTEGNVKRVHYMDKGLDIDRMTTTSPPPRSQALGYHSVRGGHWSAGRGQSPRSSVIKLSVEDSSSHSSGSTSDSGRGGSSEEGEGHGPAHAVVVAIGDNAVSRSSYV